MKKGAIFDLDGTLVSTIGLHESVWNKLFQRYNIELTDNELKEQSGKKNTLFISIIAERRGVTLDVQKLSDEKDAILIETLAEHPPVIFDGVHELLTLLKNEGVRLALATSATKQTDLLLGGDLINYFDECVFAEDVKQGKPNPEIFLKTADKLGLPAQECVIFEDANSGVEAAKAGGFFCVARDNHLGQDLSKADLIIEKYDPQTLIKILC